ncbi:MAG TPA: serine/threonine-protein kinase [Candidatus Obscuribacterales bacterium]
MYWPTAQDYTEAVQNPYLNFDDPELRTGSPELTPFGIPRPVNGSFSSVYRFQCGTRSVAAKCFLRNIEDQHQRYAHIKQFLTSSRPSLMVDFAYMQKGVRVREGWYPVVKMDWADGLTLDQCLRTNAGNVQQTALLLEQFAALVLGMQRLGIAHGDLQHANIIASQREIRLVDYDGMYVPSMAGERAIEIGHPNYQHPERTLSQFGPDVDNFSAWIIHSSLLFLKLDPELWDAFNGGDECLLFRHSDLTNPDNSPLFKRLSKHRCGEIKERADFIRRLLEGPPDRIPAFAPDLPDLVTIKIKQTVSADKSLVAETAVDVETKGTTAPKVETKGAMAPKRQHGKSSWPTVDEYLDAITRNPSFSDAQLQSARLIETDTIVGTHGVICHLMGPLQDFAIKLFLSDNPEREMRYEELRFYPKGASSRYFVNFSYQKEGIKIGGRHLPILKMDFVRGETLDNHAIWHLRSGEQRAINRTVDKFRDMVEALRVSGIAHGDLEPTNIIVDESGELKLVDYDNMYNPGLVHLKSLETGHPDYQHPGRTLSHFGPYVDNYAAFIIDSILNAIALGPAVDYWDWHRFLMELKSDPDAPLSSVPSILLKRARALRQMQRYNIEQVPALSSSVYLS